MSSAGTLDRLLNGVSVVLSPLGEGLSPENAPTFLAELGIPVSEAQATGIGSAGASITGGLQSLVDLLADIVAALDEEDWGTIIEKGIAAGQATVKVIDGFADLADALDGLPGVSAAMADELPERLLHHLLFLVLDRNAFVSELLELTGILEREDRNVESDDASEPFHTRKSFHLERIGGWLTSPGSQLAELYDWGEAGFDGSKLLVVLDRLLAYRGLPVALDQSGPTPVLDVLAFDVSVKTSTPRGLVVTLRDDVSKASLELTGPGWTMGFAVDVDLPSGTAVTLTPGGVVIAGPEATAVQGKVSATYSAVRSAEQPFELLSLPGGSRVTVEEMAASIGLGLKGNGKADLELGAELKGGKVLITMENADGFLGQVLGGFKIENTFDLGVTVSPEEGVHFHGSSTLEIQLASHISLGPIELTALTLSVGIDEGTFPVGLTTDIKASLGPLVGIIEGIGFELVFALVEDGNLGPVDLSAGFVPPTGVGLSLDVGVVKGGGYLFFDVDNEEYGGALQLDIAGVVSAKAVGIITTRMPDGSKGFALLIIISAEFSPAFQLGYGFTLNGVGGLVGLNRTVEIEVLREGVRTGAVNSIMFPSNVVENAPQIISDLRAVFPPEEGTFLIGPMAKLGWGTPTLISLSFGLIIEIPGNLAILGVLRIALPDEDTPLVNIQVNFVGTLDFDKGLLAFDASLYDSFILFLTLEGDLCVRFKWSEPAGFLISVGGFHPSFEPPAELDVPAMKRLAVNILDTDWARIRVETYFALSSNSVQLGARAEIYLGFDAFYVDGYFGFDALIRFSPFYFEISLECGLTLHVFGADVVSIHVHLSLSGPSPWHAWGTGSVTILLWEIEADFDITWGEDEDTVLPPIEVLPLMLEKLGDPANWQALLPDSSAGLWVSLRAIDDPAGTLVLHPAGRLTVRQKLAPLDFTWQRIGNQRPSDIERAALTRATSGQIELSLEARNDQFARAHFEDLSDSDKLSIPSFEPMPAGVAIGLGAELAAGPSVSRTIDYERVIIDKEEPQRGRFRPIRALHGIFLAGGAVKRSPASRAQKQKLVPRPGQTIRATGESYTVASAVDNTAHDPDGTFPSEAMARQYMARKLAGDPKLKLHVLPASEVKAA